MSYWWQRAAEEFGIRTLESEVESLMVFYLDNRHRTIMASVVFSESASCVSVPIQDILRTGLNHGARHVVIAHNHPSGESKPSKTDIELTKYLHQMLSKAEINLYDHIIYGAKFRYSFRENNLV